MSGKTNLDMRSFLEAGVHFGHGVRYWNPKMSQYIHSKTAGRCIIDLAKTVEALEKSLPFVEQLVAAGQQIMFVGTKIQAKGIIAKAAKDVGMPHIHNRWVGGMLTNYATINKQVARLKDLENRLASGELASRYSKLEVQKLQRKIDDLNFLYAGIKEMPKLPGALFVSDIAHDNLAVTEARKLRLPVVAIADSNTDPGQVSHPIPGNDDSIKSLEMLINLVAEAVVKGQGRVKTSDQTQEEAESAVEA